MDPKRERLRAQFNKEQRAAAKIRRMGRFLGFGLGGLVTSIYLYSMFSVKQEVILSEIDEELD